MDLTFNFSVYIDLGRASLVAKQHVTIAEIWEAEPDQIEKSIDHYRKASQVYRGEEQQSQVIIFSTFKTQELLL